eukprot:s2273_g12.t1
MDRSKYGKKTWVRGRFARVKLATLKERPELPICLKVLRKTHVVALEQAEHVINEKNVLTSISSPFVIRVMDTFQDTNFLYIAMELVVGGELFNLLRAKKKFSESATQFFAAEVASALFHLHSMLIVFRDLKPENILVHRTGHIKLTDFGFAKYLKAHQSDGAMPPEIAQEKGAELGVWSAGKQVTATELASEPRVARSEDCGVVGVEGQKFIVKDEMGGIPGEEEEHFTREDISCSFMLMGMFFFTMVIFYLVNYPDDDIKRYSWSIINTTISIFCVRTPVGGSKLD